jgi:hypothetical protein
MKTKTAALRKQAASRKGTARKLTDVIDVKRDVTV